MPTVGTEPNRRCDILEHEVTGVPVGEDRNVCALLLEEARRIIAIERDDIGASVLVEVCGQDAPREELEPGVGDLGQEVTGMKRVGEASHPVAGKHPERDGPKGDADVEEAIVVEVSGHGRHRRHSGERAVGEFWL